MASPPGITSNRPPKLILKWLEKIGREIGTEPNKSLPLFALLSNVKRQLKGLKPR